MRFWSATAFSPVFGESRLHAILPESEPAEARELSQHCIRL
jgi:hypothetical protein